MKDISVQEKIGILQCVDFFAKLEREELETVAFNSELLKMPRGSILFGQGAPSRELFIIRDGEVMITKMKEYGQDIDLAQYLPVECFGELDLFGAKERDATAVTMKDSSILIFPKKGIDFPDLLQQYPRISARILRNLLITVSDRVRNTHRHIGEKSRWMMELRRTLYVDRLTGLYNKHYLMDSLQEIVPAGSESVSMLMIKPDNFKTLNDSYGHAAGDKVLMLIAIFIQSVLREGDIAVRYWGDEFLVILKRTDREKALAAAKEIGRTIREVDLTTIARGDGMLLSVSVGVSFLPDDSEDPVKVIEQAYERMMSARNKGGNRIAVKPL